MKLFTKLQLWIVCYIGPNEDLSPVHTVNKVDCRRYGRLCCRFWRQVGNNLNSTACRGRRCRQLGRLCCRCRCGRLCRQCTGPKRHGRLYRQLVCTGLHNNYCSMSDVCCCRTRIDRLTDREGNGPRWLDETDLAEFRLFVAYNPAALLQIKANPFAAKSSIVIRKKTVWMALWCFDDAM